MLGVYSNFIRTPSFLSSLQLDKMYQYIFIKSLWLDFSSVIQCSLPTINLP